MKNYIDTLINDWSIIVDNSSFKKDLLRVAYIYWSENSDYDWTWTWAIIEKNWELLSRWSNVLPIEIKKKVKWRILKWTEYEDELDHAERNAIHNAARNWVKLEWSQMYMPWVPCHDCWKAIVHSWINSLVMHYSKVIKTPWHRLDSVKKAVVRLLENKINLIMVTDEIWDCESKLWGEIWYP